MTEDKDDTQGFKVEDKRTSQMGSKQDDTEEAGEVRDPTAAGEVDEKEDESSGKTPSDSGIPPVDFSTFVFSLFHSVLIQLGDIADPVNGSEAVDLDAAKQTIDILNIIQEKTKGNLTDEEKKFLENATAELKWKFLNAVKEKG